MIRYIYATICVGYVLTVFAFADDVLVGVQYDAEKPTSLGLIYDANAELSHDANRKDILNFLTALTIPNDNFWVNLSPHEPQRILTPMMSKTDLGMEFIAMDIELKRLVSELLHHDSAVGANFWNEFFSNSQTESPVQTLENKVWIVPDKMNCLMTSKMLIIQSATLKTLSDNQYSSRQLSDFDRLFKSRILPVIDDEVNFGERFKSLRSFYHAVVLATAFKQRFRNSFLGRYWVNQAAIDQLPFVDPSRKQGYFQQYLELVNDSAKDVLREIYIPSHNQHMTQYMSSGGIQLPDISIASSTTKNLDEDKQYITKIVKLGNRSTDEFIPILMLDNSHFDAKTNLNIGIEFGSTFMELALDLWNDHDFNYDDVQSVLIPGISTNMDHIEMAASKFPNARIFGLDFNYDRLKQLRRQLIKSDQAGLDRIFLLHLDMRNLDFLEAMFDVVFLISVIDLYWNHQEALQLTESLMKTLKNNGMLFMMPVINDEIKTQLKMSLSQPTIQIIENQIKSMILIKKIRMPSLQDNFIKGHTLNGGDLKIINISEIAVSSQNEIRWQLIYELSLNDVLPIIEFNGQEQERAHVYQLWWNQLILAKQMQGDPYQDIFSDIDQWLTGFNDIDDNRAIEWQNRLWRTMGLEGDYPTEWVGPARIKLIPAVDLMMARNDLQNWFDGDGHTIVESVARSVQSIRDFDFEGKVNTMGLDDKPVVFSVATKGRIPVEYDGKSYYLTVLSHGVLKESMGIAYKPVGGHVKNVFHPDHEQVFQGINPNDDIKGAFALSQVHAIINYLNGIKTNSQILELLVAEILRELKEELAATDEIRQADSLSVIHSAELDFISEPPGGIDLSIQMHLPEFSNISVSQPFDPIDVINFQNFTFDDVKILDSHVQTSFD